jgi:diazepam-binding inhibitor (GABA receptor modulating acyl-CoA-binding protein)
MNQREIFEKAVAASKTLPARPDNGTLLHLYSLYKQATEGDVNIPAPNMFDFVAKAKYDAWLKLKGTIAEEAMQQYIDLVNELCRGGIK